MLHTRTIKEAAAYFKAADPDTCLTETAIRTLILTGKVPSAKVGKKYLITLEALEAFLQGTVSASTPTEPDSIWGNY